MFVNKDAYSVGIEKELDQILNKTITGNSKGVCVRFD